MDKHVFLDINSTPERHIIDFRQWGWTDIAVLGKYHYKQARSGLDQHKHSHMLEICFCSKGEQIYKVNETLYQIKGGDLFITYPGELHGTGQFPEEKGEMYWLIINTVPAKNSRRFLRFDGKLAGEWYRQVLQLPRHFKGSRVLKTKLEKIFQCYTPTISLLNEIRIQHLIADFLLEVINCSQSATIRKKAERMDKIETYIRTNLEEPVMLTQLASLTGLSLSRFKTWFKEETGTTPLDYILKYKINKAREILLKEQFSISSVAYKTGFQSAQYFATVFKKFTGMTPGEFKQTSIKNAGPNDPPFFLIS